MSSPSLPPFKDEVEGSLKLKQSGAMMNDDAKALEQIILSANNCALMSPIVSDVNHRENFIFVDWDTKASAPKPQGRQGETSSRVVASDQHYNEMPMPRQLHSSPVSVPHESDQGSGTTEEDTALTPPASFVLTESCDRKEAQQTTAYFSEGDKSGDTALSGIKPCGQEKAMSVDGSNPLRSGFEFGSNLEAGARLDNTSTGHGQVEIQSAGDDVDPVTSDEEVPLHPENQLLTSKNIMNQELDLSNEAVVHLDAVGHDSTQANRIDSLLAESFDEVPIQANSFERQDAEVEKENDEGTLENSDKEITGSAGFLPRQTEPLMQKSDVSISPVSHEYQSGVGEEECSQNTPGQASVNSISVEHETGPVTEIYDHAVESTVSGCDMDQVSACDSDINNQSPRSHTSFNNEADASNHSLNHSLLNESTGSYSAADIDSAKKQIGVSSNAFLEHLRGAASRRKENVLKSRDSLVAKQREWEKTATAHRQQEEQQQTKEPATTIFQPFKALPILTGGPDAGIPMVKSRPVTTPFSPLLGSRRPHKVIVRALQVPPPVTVKHQARNIAAETGTLAKQPKENQQSQLVSVEQACVQDLSSTRKTAPKQGVFQARPLPRGFNKHGGCYAIPKVSKRATTVPISPLLGDRRAKTLDKRPCLSETPTNTSGLAGLKFLSPAGTMHVENIAPTHSNAAPRTPQHHSTNEYIPHSTRRAKVRADYDVKRAQHEKQRQEAVQKGWDREIQRKRAELTRLRQTL